jgi:hypothetical protein
MQIHELTQRQLDEGFMDAVNTVGQKAKQAAAATSNAYNRAGNALATAAGAAGKGVAAVKGAGQSLAKPFSQAGNAFKQAGVAQKAAGTAGKAQMAWNSYLTNLQNTQQVTPQVAETNLRAWVQKNLLGNLAYQYDQLTNKNEIEDIIKSIADPRNADQGKQTQLWTQLVKTLGVAQAGGGAAAAGAPSGKGRKGAPSGGLAPTANPGDIAKAVQASGITPAVYQNMATVVQGAAATRQINGTGNPGVDAFLKSLGFAVQ